MKRVFSWQLAQIVNVDEEISKDASILYAEMRKAERNLLANAYMLALQEGLTQKF